jgi:hypothetical protein
MTMQRPDVTGALGPTPVPRAPVAGEPAGAGADLGPPTPPPPPPTPAPHRGSNHRIAALLGGLLVLAIVALATAALLVAGGDDAEDEVATVSDASDTATTAEPPTTTNTTLEVASGTEKPAVGAVNPELEPGPTKAVGDVVFEVSELTAGTCFDDSADDMATESGFITVADCAAPHEAEVFSVSALPYDSDAAFPGNAGVIREADEQCEGTFDAYVGTPYMESTLDFGYYFPTEVSWEKYGDRTVVCYLLTMDFTPLEGVMRGSAL